MLYFDRNKNFDLLSKAIIDKELKDLFQTEKSKKYAVILHNDRFNSVEYVTKVIKDVFNYSMSKSIWLMLKAHFTGKSTLWIGSQKKAEEKKNKMISYGPDPGMVHRGAQPLQVTVEQCE
ncbi:ATP-dependent Clp protease adapter protein [Desulfonema limicola]|uniref:ATP-dependent Clp protease adapter protein n=1 Tax=Desulfonema limicola TaxID=45656 RepID=A0A975B432_9BACT|nr:ATP-dependent Clp protease adaptor ClpS [Desulfonema limicola]QTA78396.1 ATP-dependent Clp protease adapter protein [Desulfonema limicola]